MFDIRVLLKSFLSKVGFEVYEAENGTAALEVARKSLPDIILMDLMMPVLNGYEAIKALKQSPELQHIPILILSADAMKKEREKAYELGAEGYISKPFKQNDLYQELQRILGIEFIYDERESKDQNWNKTLNSDLKKLSRETVERILQADEKLNQEELLRIAGGIEENSPALGRYLKTLISQYRNEELITIIRTGRIES